MGESPRTGLKGQVTSYRPHPTRFSTEGGHFVFIVICGAGGGDKGVYFRYCNIETFVCTSLVDRETMTREFVGQSGYDTVPRPSY